jgi:hypothetical protein
MTKRNIVELVDAVSQELAHKQGELKAIEQMIFAKMQTEAELTERLKKLQAQVDDCCAYHCEFRMRVREVLEIVEGLENTFQRVNSAHAKVQAL